MEQYNNTFVSYKNALELKKLSFFESVNAFYGNDNLLYVTNIILNDQFKEFYLEGDKTKCDLILVPSKTQVLLWFIKHYNIFGGVTMKNDGYIFYVIHNNYNITNDDVEIVGGYLQGEGITYYDYLEAYEKLIEYIINYINTKIK